MSTLVNLIPVSSDLIWYFAIDIGIAIILLSAMWWVSSLLQGGSATNELTKKDNFAYGISVAGRMLALCIVLVGAVMNSKTDDFLESTITILTYGVIGIVLIKIGRFAHDKIILNRFDKEQNIQDRNVAVAMVDASSSIATALIIQSVMLWAKGLDANAMIAVISGFFVTQAILLTMTRIFERRFSEHNRSGALQAALEKGQLAVAIQHSGNLLGTAMAVTATGHMLEYLPHGYVSNVTSWFILGLGLAITQAILAALSKRIVLYRVNLEQEIDQQHNIGVASIELTISLGIALILRGLLV
ncbi:DUF350 domain-containing protein [Alteromonas sp. a30]|uniref:DUF350 domain-containing protein n=1 Tax=Alteromonas sp. a30 TaxID=2730917 RepID=UPI002280FDB0|nr:DUF350 domain-containing protein [Alteromonas sp. a30]MCY7295572.1 DUF350 domain-containing protein [Alteromonas sp. a30]